MQSASINRYATAEFRLVWTLLQFSASKSSNNNDCGDSSPPLFILTDTLLDLLGKLDKALRCRNQDTVEDALRGVLNNLYFPPKESRDQGYHLPIQVFPVLQYIIFTFISEDGTYQPIHRLPPILAAHQYCFRLRGLHCINKIVLKHRLDGWRRYEVLFVLSNMFDLTDFLEMLSTLSTHSSQTLGMFPSTSSDSGCIA